MTYKVRGKVWLYGGDSAWHFVYVDKETSAKLNKKFASKKAGFGSLPVSVTIGKTKWKTSIFPEKKTSSFLLPLKLEVRKKEEILAGDIISFSVSVI